MGHSFRHEYISIIPSQESQVKLYTRAYENYEDSFQVSDPYQHQF